MNNEPNYKATFVILNDIEKHGLVQFNEKYYNEEFFKNFLDFQKAFSNSIKEIIGKLDPFQRNYNEMLVFIIYSELSYIKTHFEMITIFLKIITNPTKLKGGFDENTNLNNMIKKICNKMQYPEKLKKSIRGLFLEEFRNTIEHQQFLIDDNGFLISNPNNSDLKKQHNIMDLTDHALQIMSIFNAMMNWANGDLSKKKTDNKWDEIVNELIEQVKTLDKKLDKIS